MKKTAFLSILFVGLATFVYADGPLFPNKEAKVAYECGCKEDRSCMYACSEFNRFVNISRKVYAYWDYKQRKYNFSFDQEAKKFAAKFTDKLPMSNKSQLFISWADQYRDGHVSVRIRDRKGQTFVSPPFWTNVINAGTDAEVVYIQQSTDESFKKYDIIKTVIFNDLVFPISEWLNKNIKAGSSKSMRRRHSVRSLFREFSSTANDRIQLVVERDGELLEPISVVRTTKVFEEEPKPQQKPEPPTEDELLGKKFVEFKMLPEGIGYLKIDAFMGWKMGEYLDQIVKENSENFESLIIDLRYNGGGSPAGDALLAHMSKEPFSRYKVKVRWSDIWFTHRRNWYSTLDLSDHEKDWTKIIPKRTIKVENPLLVDKKLVVLTGPRCFSACDTFVQAIKTQRFATIIGQAPGGGTGTPAAFNFFGEGVQARMSIEYGINNYGETIEGNPVKPSIVVLDDMESLKEGVDKTLITAVNFINEGSMKPGSQRDQALRSFQKMEMPYTLPKEDPFFDEPSTEPFEAL